MPHLTAKDVTGSAYCTARGRLPLAAQQTLLSRCTGKMAECARDTGCWLGHRLFMLDGSSFSMSVSLHLFRIPTCNDATGPDSRSGSSAEREWERESRKRDIARFVNHADRRKGGLQRGRAGYNRRFEIVPEQNMNIETRE